MKEIVAIIRMNRINATKRALAAAGAPAITARKVMGRGQGLVDYMILKGVEQGFEEAANHLGPGPRMIPKRMIQIVVPDSMVPKVVETIIAVNRTNQRGDGKIFVQPVLDAVRVRTNESGELAINENIA